MEMRVLKLCCGLAVLVFIAVVVVFVFGTPQSALVVTAQDAPTPLEPGAAAPGSAGGVAQQPVAAAEQQPGVETAQDPGSSGDLSGMGAADPDAKVPEPDPSTPLAIEIPGCVCHSDDPKEVERHAAYRMNQCAGCHMGAPQGQ